MDLDELIERLVELRRTQPSTGTAPVVMVTTPQHGWGQQSDDMKESHIRTIEYVHAQVEVSE